MAISLQQVSHIVLDRDGTLIRHIPYLCDPAQVELLPTVLEGLNVLVQSGRMLFLHTNQSGVARGYFSLADAIECNRAMLKKIGMGDGLFEDMRISAEPPDHAVCRKPSPKYGLELMEKYDIDKSSLCYVGDNITDLMTAANIGCMGIGVNTGVHDLRQELQERNMSERFPVFDNFLDAANFICAHQG